jgi:sialic acid synthase SpsE
VIEKHITLDRSLRLVDYVSALAPAEFGRFVARIRAAEEALGRGGLEPTEPERAYRRKVVKKVTAIRDLARDAMIGAADVTLLRSAVPAGDGMLEQLEDVIGRRTRRPIPAGAVIHREDLG